MNAETQKERKKQQSVISTVVVNEFEPVKAALGQNREAEEESDETENTDSRGSFPAVAQIRELVEKTSDENVDEGKLGIEAKSDQHDKE